MEKLINTKTLKEIYRVSQLSNHGEFICDFGFFDSEEKAYKELRKGFKDLYKDIDFIKDCSYNNREDGEWDFTKYDFIIVIRAIKFNTFMEV